MSSVIQAGGPGDGLVRWLPYRRPQGVPRLRLFCFPYAGGSAMVYRGWPRELPTEVEVCAVQPPGRERRLAESPFTRMQPFIETLGTALRPLFDRPFVLLGHSLGAKVAFELARRLEREGGPRPRHLVISGSRAPQMPDPKPPIHRLPEDELLERVQELGGTPREVLAHEELMQLMIPLLRADFELNETYAFEPGQLLECPLSAFGGTDDEDVPPETIEGWREMTRGPFRSRIFEGDHFFFQVRLGDFLAEVLQDLRRYL